MAQTARVNLAEVEVSETSLKQSIYKTSVAIRVSLNSYFAAFFLANFITGFLVFLGIEMVAAVLFVVSWIAIPALAWSDRIVFDGKCVFRTGIIPALWASFCRKPRRIKILHIEQIETQAVRALKRGGNVFYRYQTSVQGKGLRLAFASGREDYRHLIGKLFNSVPTDVLDNRSLELRDYLKEPHEITMKAEFARIPSMEVLENSVNEFQTNDRSLRSKRINFEVTDANLEKAEDLRQLANELRLSGKLLQALEAFRRALLLDPINPWLTFEFARCLHSFAGLERNQKLAQRANAALRLAELRAGNDSKLLARIGESYFQYGNRKRAFKTFYQTLSIAGEDFRAVRGLAEIALREGKIAHVIHHFGIAAHFAENNALRRWARGESKYFSRLNDDNDYMEAEVTRINWLEGLERKKRSTLRFSLAGLLVILLGVLFNNTVALVGWTASSISISMWLVLILSRGLLAERCPIIETDK